MGKIYNALRQRAASLKQNTCALYLASKHPAVPAAAKVIAVLVVAYALSPIDLVPDFIPVLGYLDDLVLLPLGICLAIRLIPESVWDECRAQAMKKAAELPRNRRAAVVIVIIWLLALAGVALWLRQLFGAA